MIKFQQPTFINSHVDGVEVASILQEPIRQFYRELEMVVERNDASDFHEWFSEQTYLSTFFNGMVRHDTDYRRTVVQEYCTTDQESKKHGRCDGFLNDSHVVLVFEAKRGTYDEPVKSDHFDLNAWLVWDQSHILDQLEKYLACDERFFIKEGRYKQCYLVTIVFKIVKEKPEEHIKMAQKELFIEATTDERPWYYAVSFFGDNIKSNEKAYGLEVYGTVSEKLIEQVLQ